MKTLHAKIGELTLENDLLEHALGKVGLLSARKWSTGRTRCRSRGKTRRSGSTGSSSLVFVLPRQAVSLLLLEWP